MTMLANKSVPTPTASQTNLARNATTDQLRRWRHENENRLQGMSYDEWKEEAGQTAIAWRRAIDVELSQREFPTRGKSMTTLAIEKRKKAQMLSPGEGEGNSVWVMTTEDLDRDGETVDPAGIDFSQFDLNPVFISNHNTDGDVTDVILGRVVRHWLDDVGEGTKWPQVGGKPRPAQMAEIEWNTVTAKGREAQEMAHANMLNGGSISFLPKGDPTKNEQGGNHYGEVLLLEFTACPVGSNPSAIRVKSLKRATTQERRQANKAARRARYAARKSFAVGDVATLTSQGAAFGVRIEEISGGEAVVSFPAHPTWPKRRVRLETLGKAKMHKRKGILGDIGDWRSWFGPAVEALARQLGVPAYEMEAAGAGISDKLDAYFQQGKTPEEAARMVASRDGNAIRTLLGKACHKSESTQSMISKINALLANPSMSGIRQIENDLRQMNDDDAVALARKYTRTPYDGDPSGAKDDIAIYVTDAVKDRLAHRRSTNGAKAMKRKLWINAARKSAWLLKSEGATTDDEMKEYLEERGLEDVRIEEAEPGAEEGYVEDKASGEWDVSSPQEGVWIASNGVRQIKLPPGEREWQVMSPREGVWQATDGQRVIELKSEDTPTETETVASDVADTAEPIVEAGAEPSDAVDAAMEEEEVPVDMRKAVKAIAGKKLKAKLEAKAKRLQDRGQGEGVQVVPSKEYPGKYELADASGNRLRQSWGPFNSIADAMVRLKSVKKNDTNGDAPVEPATDTYPAGFKALAKWAKAMEEDCKALHKSEHGGVIACAEKCLKLIKATMGKAYKDLVDPNEEQGVEVEEDDAGDELEENKSIQKSHADLLRQALDSIERAGGNRQAEDAISRAQGSIEDSNYVRQQAKKAADYLRQASRNESDEYAKGQFDRAISALESAAGSSKAVKRIKRLSKAATCTVKDVSEFLDDAADASDTPKRLKGGMKYHAASLKAMIEEPAEDEPMTEEAMTMALKSWGENIDDAITARIADPLYRATGVRVGEKKTGRNGQGVTG